MSRIGDAIDAKNTTIRVLMCVIAMLLVMCMFLAYSTITMRDNFTITIPPNVQNGAIVNVGEFNSSVVYNFAASTLITLNRWTDDGSIDYLDKIEELAPRFTGEYYEYLRDDLLSKLEEDELKNRQRYMLEILNDGYVNDPEDKVEIVNESTWIVDVTVTLVERIEDFEVKNRVVTYPLVVRKANNDPENNSWGLVIDGYPSNRLPVTIDDDNESEA